ncbi:MAG: hypothetical protein U1B83_08005 [Candidatus Cloacimonadaceae bacterium]|nr:hypothetical protein [Candidatus Cloacimonadaceae bacterium]
MKKLLLPLLLLVAFGMLAAVESDPSEVVGYVRYNCYAGYNNVAYPMGAPTTAEAIGQALLPNVDALYKWVPASQTWEAVFYDADFDEWFGTIPVLNGDVLVISAQAGFSFYSLGSPIDNIVYNIAPGYNYISLPLNRSSLTTAEAVGGSIGNVDAVYVWSNQTQTWDAVIYDADFDEWFGSIPIAIGDVMVVSSSASGVWPSRGASTSSIRNSK